MNDVIHTTKGSSTAAPVVALDEAQQKAIAHVAARASAAQVTTHPEMAALRAYAASAEVTMNFHPDRLRPDGVSVVDGLLRDGLYRSQYETGVTNGAPTAYPGGSRDEWEHALFGDAYRGTTSARPKYGTLNLLSHGDGGGPRFGSCFFVLRPHMLARCTFSWGDSHGGPAHVGTLDVLEPVLAALLQACAAGDALGARMDVPALLQRLAAPPPREHGRALDAYIEAQVHGSIALETDVALLVIDPSFVGTPIGVGLHELASKHGFPITTHDGFVLGADEVPTDFRGPRMPDLARRIGGRIDAHVLGVAAASLHRAPIEWADWDTPPETWQHIKQLWHCLVRFGRPGGSRLRCRGG